jgi:hypothetical protein
MPNWQNTTIFKEHECLIKCTIGLFCIISWEYI